MDASSRSRAYALLGALTLIWGTSFILIKQGLKVFSPDEVGSLRVVSASLFLLPVAIIQLKKVQRSDYWKLFTSGMLGVFIPAFLFATAQTRLDSSVAGILNTLTPFFTMLIGGILFRQRFGMYAIIGMLLGFAGAVVVSLSRDSSLTGFNVFALLIVLACLSYGANLNFIKFKLPAVPSITLSSVALMLIGPLALIYLLTATEMTGKLASVDGAWRAFGFIVLLGLMSTAIAINLSNELVKMTSPMFASSVTYLMPIVAVMWGVVDGELLHIGHFIGMAAIITGVYLANRKK